MGEELNVYGRLNNAQLELKAPKGQYNSFAKFNYRSAEDILEAVKPINHKHGLNLNLTDRPVMVGDRIYIEAKAILTNVDNPDETIELTAYARESLTKKGMDDSQITGTASSYARKYCLNGLYLIDDTKDADTDEYKNNIDNAPKPKKVTKTQISAMNAVIKSIAQLIDKTPAEAQKTMLEHQGLPDRLEDLNVDQHGTFLRYMNGIQNDMEKKAKAKKKEEKEVDDKFNDIMRHQLRDMDATNPDNF